MSASQARWYVVTLLVALAPSIAYVGHWEPRFDIPLTDYYWGIPVGRTHRHAEDAASHGDHCHGDSTCSGEPTMVGANVALLRGEIEMLGMSALLLLVLAAVRAPHIPGSRAPETPPPRRLVVVV